MNYFELPSVPARRESQPLPPGHSAYSRNSPRKHGYVPNLALASDERESFYALEERFYDEYQPTCATESLLIDEVTLNYWRLQRARTLEASTLADDRENEKLLALYQRYRASFERSFFHALQLLRKVKAEDTRFIAQSLLRSSVRALIGEHFVSHNTSRDIESGSDDGSLPLREGIA